MLNGFQGWPRQTTIYWTFRPFYEEASSLFRLRMPIHRPAYPYRRMGETSGTVTNSSLTRFSPEGMPWEGFIALKVPNKFFGGKVDLLNYT